MDRANVHNWGPLLSEDQLKEINDMVQTLELDEIKHDMGMSDTTVPSATDTLQPSGLARLSMRGWFNEKEHKRMFELGRSIASLANRELYGMDISGGVPDIQYTVYTEGHHYDWHKDIDWQGTTMEDRKVSAIILISDPDEYEGGELQFRMDSIGGEALEEKPAKGTVITFPSYLRHKVHPVTKGVRESIVIWATGPRFR